MSRLIDADALKDRLQSLAYDDWNQGVSTSWADAYRECADMVDEQPTIEPERKKGKAVVKSDGEKGFWVCNQCGEDVHTWDKYCSECGAKLKGNE